MKRRFPEVIQPYIWPFLLKQAEFNLNNIRLRKSGNCAPNILVPCTTKSISDIIIRSVARCTYLMQIYTVPVLFQNGTSKSECACTLEDTQFTRETFPSYLIFLRDTSVRNFTSCSAKLFYCSITKKRINSKFLEVHLRK